MKIQVAVSVSIVALIIFVANGFARPSKRLDQGTRQCRILNQGTLDWETEAWGIGGQKFREVCKSCHYRGNPQGAKYLHAESFMPKAWNRIFYKRRVKCAKDGSWDVLSQKELLLINDYLYRNGDWTYNPNTAESCG